MKVSRDMWVHVDDEMRAVKRTSGSLRLFPLLQPRRCRALVSGFPGFLADPALYRPCRPRGRFSAVAAPGQAN